jgi:MFS family permease
VTAAPGTMRSALQHRDFRRLVVALAASQAGDWLYNVALLAFVYERTSSAGWLAATTAARVLPVVVLGPIGGALADRWDRRRIMVASDTVRVVLMLALAAVAYAGLPVVLAPVLAALATAAASPYPSCAAASTPRLVPDADLPGANAARAAIGMGAIAAGPVVGALLLLLGSPGTAFLLNAGTFAVSALAVLSIPGGPVFRPGRAAADRTGLLADVVEGARALRAHPVAVRLVGADLVCSVVYGMQTVLLLLLGHRLGLGAAGYGYLLAAVGVGGVLGTTVSGRAAASARPQAVLVAALLTIAGAGALLAVTPWLAGVLVWAVAGGAGAIVVEVLTETVLQREVDEDVFARAYGIAFPASIGGIVLGSLVAAPLVALFGLTGALLGIGVLAGGYALLVALPHAQRSQDGGLAEPVPAVRMAG